MNAAGRRWAARELRRGWRPVVVVAVLTAVAGGAAMAATTGARRSLVVVAETMDERRQPDVMSLPNLPGFDWRPIVELPYVESYGLLAATQLCLKETGGLGDRIGERVKGLCAQPPAGGGWYRSIVRMDVLEGREPTGPLEIAVNRRAQRAHGWEVGDRLHVDGVGPGRLEEYWGGRSRGGRRWGPTFRVTVTGVFEGADDVWRVITGGQGQPGFVMSTSFIPTYGDSLEYRLQAFLRLRGGERDIRRLGRDIARITGDSAFPIRNVREAQRRVERSTRVEATALALFAAAVLAAAAVLLGQALARLTRTGARDAPVLRSLGMAPRSLVAALAAPGAVVGVLGAVGALAVALAASPNVPIGLARSFELDAGIKVDAPVLVVGALGIALLVTLASGAAAALAVGRLRSRSARPPGRSVASLTRLPLPPSVALGVRMALERPSGGDSTAARPALIGASVGVLAVVAAITVQQGIVGSLEHPERAGRAWDVAYEPTLGDRAIASDEDIAGAAEVTRAVVSLDGLPAPAYAIRPVGRPLHHALLEGRSPRRADEVALGPSTASALRVRVGDTLAAGPEGSRPVRVVGTALLWEEGGHAAYDEGAWTTDAGLKRLAPHQIDWNMHFLDLRRGADAALVDRRLTAAGGVRNNTWTAEEPAGLDNLRTTDGLPALLAGLLALLGAGAVGHALITSSRRRRRDLAVLRALGLSGRQVRVVLASQATTVAVLGLAAGVPLGLVAGQLIWRWIATSMPLAYVAPGGVLAALAVIPAALLLVNAVALLPARTAARTRPAAVLRAE